MGRIAVLADHVIDQIAAGEVIERPASVVKELVENAFDAGADAVQVELEDGGLQRITVSDDGSGMARDDATTSVLRHATSKLRIADDLEAIRTLGFRGEALSSIASVSDMVIATRQENQDVGTRIRMRGGEVVSVDDYGGPTGTTVDVKHLFFNTPARKKFMRSPATELAHVVEAALRVALGSRRGGVIVTSGARRLLDIPEDQSESQRIMAGLGPRVKELIPFAHEDDGIRISGFVTPLDVTRGDTKGTWFFVNGRFVRERLLQRALVEVFRPQLPRGQYPYAAIYIDVDPTSVDVNVHPQKLEVRFSDSATVYRVLTSSLTRLFTDGAFSQLRAFVPESVSGAHRATERFEARRGRDTTRSHEPYAYPPARQGATIVSDGDTYRPSPLQADLATTPATPVPEGSGRWSMVEQGERILFIDLKALARARMEERIRDELAGGEEAVARELVLPEVFETDPVTEGWLEKSAAELRRLGLDVTPVGPERWALSSLPAVLGDVSAAGVVTALRSLVGETRLPAMLHALTQLARMPEDDDERRDWISEALRDGPDGKTVYACESNKLERFLARGDG
ncbi:MAG: DNA mismatch repair endonuclease MutL [Myxococcota bacterium]